MKIQITAFCDYYIDGFCETVLLDDDFLPDGNVALASMIDALLELECIENPDEVDSEQFENGVSVDDLLEMIESRLGEGYVEVVELD